MFEWYSHVDLSRKRKFILSAKFPFLQRQWKLLERNPIRFNEFYVIFAYVRTYPFFYWLIRNMYIIYFPLINANKYSFMFLTNSLYFCFNCIHQNALNSTILIYILLFFSLILHFRCFFLFLGHIICFERMYLKSNRK